MMTFKIKIYDPNLKISGAQLARGGGVPYPFLKIEKKVP